jgi:hypothetical protein
VCPSAPAAVDATVAAEKEGTARGGGRERRHGEGRRAHEQRVRARSLGLSQDSRKGSFGSSGRRTRAREGAASAGTAAE